MKKTLFIAIAACIITVANAETVSELQSEIKGLKTAKKQEEITLRKLDRTEVSYQSKQNFKTDFEGITNVSWTKEDYYDVADFTWHGKDTRAYYDNDGNLVGTIAPASFTDLPLASQEKIKRDYKGYNVEHVIFYDDNESNSTNMILYGTQFEDADNYFVELGKGTKEIVLQVSTEGDIYYFATIL